MQTKFEITVKQSGRIALPRILGFTLYCVWVLMMFYSITLYVTPHDFRSVLYLNLFISLSVLALTIFCVSKFLPRADKWVLSKLVIYPSTAVLTAATLIICFVTETSALGIVLTCVSAVLTGVASGLLFLGWFRLYSDAGSSLAAIETSAAWMLSCLVALVLYYLPQSASAAVVVLAVATSGLLLRQSALKRPERPTPHREHQLQKRTRRMFIRGAFAALGIGLIDGFSDVMSGFRFAAPIPWSYDILLMLGGALVTGIILLVALFARRNMVIYMYRLVFISMVIGCLGIPYLKQAFFLPSVMIFGGYIGFMVVLIVVCADISNYFDLPAVKVIGCVLCAQYLGELVGSALAHGMTIVNPEANATIFSLVSIAFSCVLILIYVLLFSEKDLTETSIGEMLDTEAETNGSSNLSQEQELVRVVQILRERGGLSARETDVLPLLIKGRTIARIQEELFISQGTVSTHIRHIYQKTNVHNRQSLLDLIEEIKEDGDRDAHSDR